MSVHVLLLAALCTFLIPGIARADLDSFMSAVNAGYTRDTTDFQARLADRFAASDSQLRLVVLSVDSPADAVISLWIAEQARLPIGRVLQYYQQFKPQGWDEILRSLGLQTDSGTLDALQRGDLGWFRQLAAVR